MVDNTEIVFISTLYKAAILLTIVTDIVSLILISPRELRALSRQIN